MATAKKKSENKKDVRHAISAMTFFKYGACPHWLYFDEYGDPENRREISDFNRRLLERGLLHEEDVMEGMEYTEVRGKDLQERFAKTVELMKEGVPRIYHGILMADDLVGEPDILEKKTDRPSDFGSYHYAAIDIKSAEKLTDSHKYQLVLYGELLSAVQGMRPREGYIMNKNRLLLGFPLREFELQFHEALRHVRRIFDGEKPQPHLSSACKNSPWFQECVAYAESERDIALLYNVKKKTVMALREAGVRTVEDAAEMDVDGLAGSTSYMTRKMLDRAKLQAEALIEKAHYIRRPYSFDEKPLELFFDIEGDPLRQVEYLFGFLVREDGEEEYKPFIAEKPEDEGKMWKEFIEWIGTLPDRYAVYHYGTYEKTSIAALEARYGGSAALGKFRDRMVDLNATIKDCLVFPLYFYGIKDIGEYIGFERSGKITGGGESIMYYEDWLTKGDRKALDEVILYNKDDVLATRYLKDWLVEESERDELGTGSVV